MIIKFKSGIRIKMEVKEAAEFVKELQDTFPDCEVTLETVNKDPAENLKTAKIFGELGVRGKWRKLKEKKND